MNFKFKKKKVIASIVIPIILWIVMAVAKFPNSKILSNFANFHDFGNLFSSGNLTLFVIEVAVVFVIISIFQDKYAI